MHGFVKCKGNFVKACKAWFLLEDGLGLIQPAATIIKLLLAASLKMTIDDSSSNNRANQH